MASLGFVGDLEVIAGIRHALQTKNFNRSGRRRIDDGAAAIVKHGAHFAKNRAADEKVAGPQSAVLHQDGGHRTASFIDTRFQHRAGRGSVGISAKFAQIGNQQNSFQQFVETDFLFGGNLHEFRVAAPFGGHQAGFGELALHAFEVGFGLVDFIDGHDDRNFGGLGVIDGFFRLRHHAVIGSDHQHDDVGDLCASRTHARERFVARSVDENDAAIELTTIFVRADVLGNSAGFAAGNICLANGVEQTGFAVIHVAHDGNHGRARLEAFLGLFLGNFQNHFFFERDDAYYAAKGLGQSGGGRHVERLVDAGEDAAVQQIFQQLFGAHVEFFGQLANGDSFGDGDVTWSARLWRRDDRGGGAAIAHSRTLARGMELALAFLFPFVGNRALALWKLARVERLAGFSLRRKFLRERRQHTGTARRTRTGTRARGHRPAALLKRTAGRSTWARWPRRKRSAGSWLLRTHRLARTRTTSGALRSLT